MLQRELLEAIEAVTKINEDLYGQRVKDSDWHVASIIFDGNEFYLEFLDVVIWSTVHDDMYAEEGDKFDLETLFRVALQDFIDSIKHVNLRRNK